MASNYIFQQDVHHRIEMVHYKHLQKVQNRTIYLEIPFTDFYFDCKDRENKTFEGLTLPFFVGFSSEVEVSPLFVTNFVSKYMIYIDKN